MKLDPYALATVMMVLAGPVLAQTAAPSGYGSWSVQLGAATDNRSKDASKSNGQGYVYGTAVWTSPDGLFYAAPGFETVDSSNGSQLEFQGFVGLKTRRAGTGIDLRAAYKYQAHANPGTDNKAWELTGALTRPVGPVNARLQLQYSPDGMGRAESWRWVEGRIGYDVTSRLNATVAIGRREQDASVDYTGWNVGLTYAAGAHASLDLRYYATDANVPGEQYADRLVAGVNVVF